MKTCPNCHSETEDRALSCPVCGTILDAIGQIPPEEPFSVPEIPMPIMEIPTPGKYDLTADYSTEDIQGNKIPAMCTYLLGVVGIVIALLLSPDSPYIRFHSIQALKFSLLEVLVGLFALLLCWTVIIPIIGAVFLLVLLIAKFVCFLDIARNKTVASPFLHMFRFLN